MRRISGRGALTMRGKKKLRSECGMPKKHESHLADARIAAERLALSHVRLGQSEPTHYPYREDATESAGLNPLGVPMSIEDVAELLGCSPWTVRQKYLPQGLPHLRASASGKFVFFRGQIVNWILERQTKGRR